jgi:hypothetical protein
MFASGALTCNNGHAIGNKALYKTVVSGPGRSWSARRPASSCRTSPRVSRRGSRTCSRSSSAAAGCRAGAALLQPLWGLDGAPMRSGLTIYRVIRVLTRFPLNLHGAKWKLDLPPVPLADRELSGAKRVHGLSPRHRWQPRGCRQGYARSYCPLLYNCSYIHFIPDSLR